MFDVGQRIKELRMQRGITVNALANLAGISQSFLRDIELGNKKPTVEYLEYICDALKISLSAFFEPSKEIDTLEAAVRNLSPAQQASLLSFLKSLR